jgi:FtsH-binding integral membrane protein
MAYAHFVRQAYRLYAAALVLWAAWSGVWLVTDIGMTASAVGTGWFVVAAFGAIVGVALALTRVSDEYRLFKTGTNRERVRRFRDHVFGGQFLGLYVVAIAAWSFLTVEWLVVDLGIVGRTIVGYGWFLVALYGLALAIGLTTKHSDAVAEEVDEVTPSTVDLTS